ncbi:MAG: hypothetical protein ACT4QD_20275, partial [Acidobacteriota bacterium]
MRSRVVGAVLALALGPLAAAAQPVVNDPYYDIVEFFRYTSVSGGGVGDVRVGPGTGSFGYDVFIADPGAFGTTLDGRVRRLADLNGDGDAMDAGESTIVISTLASPAGIDFGFGGDLYVLNYPSDTSIRFVHKLTNATPPVLSQFTTTTIFNPNSLRFHELTPGVEQILITAAQTFTVFGGTNDGRLFKVGSAGGAPAVWSSGVNVAEGTPAGWWDPNFSTGALPDGSVVVRNAAVRATAGGAIGNGSLWAVKDLNADGDANDVGEARRLAANFANGLWGVTFDAMGVGYVGTSTQILRLEDKNLDGDFYDFGMGTFDAGENQVFVSGLTSSSHIADFGPNGEIYVASTDASVAAAPIGIVYLIRPADTDGDGRRNDVDDDDDGDGHSDLEEAAAGSDPLNPNSTPEVCDGADNDGDGEIDEGLPDTDNDGESDCADADDDNDGVLDAADAFPLDPTESVDTDGDGVGNNADEDDDNDGVPDADETAAGSDPLDGASTPEICDGLDNDLNDGVDEGFSNADGDAQADCVDPDDDNDGVPDTTDAFPLDPSESVDSDGDGVGNNADIDDDNDGVPDAT